MPLIDPPLTLNSSNGQWESRIDSQGLIGWVQIALGIRQIQISIRHSCLMMARPGLFYILVKSYFILSERHY
jgi:hypothetical protein